MTTPKTLYHKWMGTLSDPDTMPNWDNAESNFLSLFESFFVYGVKADKAEDYIPMAVEEHRTTLPMARALFTNVPFMKIKYTNVKEYMDMQRKSLLQVCNSVFFSVYPIDDEGALEDIAIVRAKEARRKKQEIHKKYVEQFPIVDLNDLPEILMQKPIAYDDMFKDGEDD